MGIIMNYISKTLPRFINKMNSVNNKNLFFNQINMRFFAHKQVFPTFAESVDSGEGQFVKEGQILAVIDIEKSTIELFAEKGGKVTKLFVKEGDNVKPKDQFIEIDDKAINTEGATEAMSAEAP